jgi:hypothetical protein
MLVLMALITTFMTGPLLSLIPSADYTDSADKKSDNTK